MEATPATSDRPSRAMLMVVPAAEFLLLLLLLPPRPLGLLMSSLALSLLLSQVKGPWILLSPPCSLRAWGFSASQDLLISVVL